MKKILYFFIGLMLLLTIGWFVLDAQLNNGKSSPDKTVWTSFIGRDTTVGILPDQYANYFTYTVGRTRKDVGFRIKGKFPAARYFSFNVYSLGDNATQGSLVDYQIHTDSGLPSHFVAHADSTDTDDSYTIHIIPDHFDQGEFENSLVFDNDTRLLTMVIRLYDYEIDDFGGQEYPTVEAFKLSNESEEQSTLTTNLPRALDLRAIVRRRSLPRMVERLSVLYETEQTEVSYETVDKEPSDAPKSFREFASLPFHAIDTKGYIENNDNRYLLAGITKQEGEVYHFKFKPPSHTTGPDNINQTDVRYWSFNLGNSRSYNFNAIKDEDAITAEDGYVHIVLSDDDPTIIELAKNMNYNFLEWNMPWQKALILFRHMLADPEFEAQIDEVPPIKSGMGNFSAIEAQQYIGAYAPQGKRMSKEDFIAIHEER